MFGWIRKIFQNEPSDQFRAEFPSVEYADHFSLFRVVLHRLDSSDDGEFWASFEAVNPGGGEDLVVQVIGNVVNTCLEEVDMERVLSDGGHVELARRVEDTGERIYHLDNATPEELARMVDAAFVHHYRLPTGYRVLVRILG